MFFSEKHQHSVVLVCTLLELVTVLNSVLPNPSLPNIECHQNKNLENKNTQKTKQNKTRQFLRYFSQFKNPFFFCNSFQIKLNQIQIKIKSNRNQNPQPPPINQTTPKAPSHPSNLQNSLPFFSFIPLSLSSTPFFFFIRVHFLCNQSPTFTSRINHGFCKSIRYHQIQFGGLSQGLSLLGSYCWRSWTLWRWVRCCCIWFDGCCFDIGTNRSWMCSLSPFIGQTTTLMAMMVTSDFPAITCWASGEKKNLNLYPPFLLYSLTSFLSSLFVHVSTSYSLWKCDPHCQQRNSLFSFLLLDVTTSCERRKSENWIVFVLGIGGLCLIWKGRRRVVLWFECDWGILIDFFFFENVVLVLICTSIFFFFDLEIKFDKLYFVGTNNACLWSFSSSSRLYGGKSSLERW